MRISANNVRFRIRISINNYQPQVLASESDCSFCSLSVMSIRTDLIANAANRSNQSPAVSIIDLATQIIDVYVHYVCRRFRIELPNLLDDGRPGNGLALMAHQEFQQGEFLGAEADRVTSAADDVADAIEFEIFNLYHPPHAPACAAKYGASSRGQ